MGACKVLKLSSVTTYLLNYHDGLHMLVLGLITADSEPCQIILTVYARLDSF